MLKKSLLLLAFALCSPAYAFDVKNLSPDERTALRAEIRSYLIENPEVLMEVISELEKRQQATASAGEQGMIAQNSDAIFNDQNSWVGGNLKGDITLVEFLDYRCGYCRKAEPEVAELIRSDGNIRFIIKEYPILGDASVLASQFAIAVRLIAGDDIYKQAHDELMQLPGDITKESLATVADDLGQDSEAIFAKMASSEVQAIIDANHKLGEALQINGTPSFILQDSMLRGYLPLDDMRDAVAEERKK